MALPVGAVGVVLVAQPSFLFRHAGAAALPALGVTVGCSQALFSAGTKMCVRALKQEVREG